MPEIAVVDIPADVLDAAGAAARSDLPADLPHTVDYFDTNDTTWVTLPDGIQRVEIKTLTEGERRKYLNQTNREVRMNARTRDLVMQSAAGDDEHELIRLAVVGWEVSRAGNPVPFTANTLNDALSAWPVHVWQKVLRAIREQNDWLLGGEDDLDALVAERDDLDQRISRLRDSAVKN